MPILETIFEVVVRTIIELIIYGLFYWTGFAFLKIISFGKIKLAPFVTYQEKNRSKKKRHQMDWSIWLHRPLQGRMLKAECTCLVGLFVWVAIICVTYIVVYIKIG